MKPNRDGAGHPSFAGPAWGPGCGGRPGVGLPPDAPSPPRDPMLVLHTHEGRAGARVHAGVPEGGGPGAMNVPVAGRAGVRGGRA